jgi:uncharacterized protein with HEPN domain
MHPDIRTYLSDILTAIEEIESFFDGMIMEFFFFINDRKTKRAVERNLSIIGEAANRIKKVDSSFDLPNIREIIATRNRIVHGYENVSDEILWTIVTDFLPELKQSVKNYLSH